MQDHVFISRGHTNMTAAHRTRTLIVGNSDGIGFALTNKLLARGETVIGVSRSRLDLNHPNLHQHQIDLSSLESKQALDGLSVQYETLDCLVYCAGIGEPFDTEGVSQDGDIVRVNFGAFADCLNMALPHMEKAESGRIVVLSSIGDRLSPGAPSYGATKAGLTAYALGLRLPLAKKGIGVSVVRFGFVDTKMAKSDVKPLMITADRAADIVLSVINKGQAVKTYPLLADWLVTLITFVTRWRIRFS